MERPRTRSQRVGAEVDRLTMSIGKTKAIPSTGVRFSMVPNTLFMDRSLEPQDCLTWCYLCLNARGRGFADVTDKGLAEAMGVVDRTVRRSLDRLEGSGFIRRERSGPKRTIHLIPDNRADQQVFRLKVV
jgi:hypothetical protein